MERSPNSHIKNVKITRREFLGGAGSAAALFVMAQGRDKYNKTHEREGDLESISEDVKDEIVEAESIEEVAEDLPSPVFDQVLNARTIEAGGLRRDQVVFVDNFGRQLTEAFDLTESVGLSPREMTWSFKGGKPAGIPGTWIKEQEDYISEQSGVPIADIEMLSVYLDLDNADQEHFTSRVEMVYANATAVVPEDPYRRDALTIIREDTYLGTIPVNITQYLLPQIVGIACEESRFDASKTSPAGAVGFMQTMPDVFEKYKKEHSLSHLDPRNLNDQLPVGMQHIEVSYQELIRELTNELEYITRAYFSGNKATMEKYFLVPLIINSYNAGQARMIKVVQWFIKKYPDPESTMNCIGQTEMLSGYDLFFVMTHQCALEGGVDRFGDDASTYVSKVMGWTNAFSAYEQNMQEQVLASN